MQRIDTLESHFVWEECRKSKCYTADLLPKIQRKIQLHFRRYTTEVTIQRTRNLHPPQRRGNIHNR
jgi:hypothetical protein